MLYTSLGTSGIVVSRLALGTATFGVAPSMREVDTLVNAAIELGFTFFDTANSYGNRPHFDRPGLPQAAARQSAEELLGAALREVRDQVFIATKVGEGVKPHRSGPPIACLTRQHIREQAHTSLRRLGTDRIDLYYAHHPDPDTPAEQIVGAFQELINAGDVRSWAVSNHSSQQLRELLEAAEQLGAPPPVANQVLYHLAHRDAERDLLQTAAQNQVGVVAYSPLGGGLLAGAHLARRRYVGDRRWGGRAFNDHELRIADSLDTASTKWGKPPAAVALSWLLRRADVAVIGPSSPDRLKVTAEALTIDLDHHQLEFLDSLIN